MAKNVVIANFGEFNQRRYSAPWVCTMTEDGRYDFKARVGTYTGNARNGEAGDLVVFEPQEGLVYAYGQKDNRGSHTEIHWALWDGEKFIPCDKLGRPIENP
jgi:signal peptidase I